MTSSFQLDSTCLASEKMHYIYSLGKNLQGKKTYKK